MIKTKKQMFLIIASFVLVIVLGTVTFAFFNYTRTGTSNIIKTGRIYFNSEEGSSINLDNVFPIERSSAATDDINSSEVLITVTGDTTYGGGIEYLITATDVNIKTNNKKIPVGLIITPEKTGELGTNNVNYFDDGERGGNTSYYKIIAGENEYLTNGQYLMVGYIRPGEAEVNGTIGIRAFVDKNNIAISDTYDGSESEINGTTNSWADGRVVLTTDEWNSLQGNNAISFRIKVEANEGIWIGEPLSRNDIKNINSEDVFTSQEKSLIKEVKYIRMSEEMINTHSGLIDLTAENGEGVVKGWLEDAGNNMKTLYIASPGETYFPVDSSAMLSGLTNLTNFDFENINTSEVSIMVGLFSGCSSIEHFDMSSFDTSSATKMQFLFSGCSSLISVNLSGIGNDNLSDVGSMFTSCVNLIEVNMQGFNFGTASLNGLFSGLPNLEVVILKNSNMSNVRIMNGLFAGSTKIEKIDLSNLGGNNLLQIGSMFAGCTNLKEINMEKFNFGTASLSSLFSNLEKLENVNLKNSNMSNVSDLSGLFSNCTKIEKIDLSNLGGNNISNVSGMFSSCNSLVEINMSGFNFGNASVSSVFRFITTLESVNLSNSTIKNTMEGLFNNCINLVDVNLSGINMINVTSLHSMFQGCTSLEEIDLSSIDTSNVTSTYAMFSGASSLRKIYVSNTWNIDNVSSSEGSLMFYDCTSLVGGNGTVFDSTKFDKTMAVIDTPSTPGYLTNIVDKPTI